MGDGFMALFGMDDASQSVERAIRAGAAMLSEVEDMNPSLEKLYQQRLRIGIGIHFGGTVIGTIGDPKSPKMTAIGDAVNLASRIESANKNLGTNFLISDAAYQQANAVAIVGQSFQVSIPGKSGEYTVHEVTGVQPSLLVEEDDALKSIPTARSGWLTQLKQAFAAAWKSFK